MRSCAAYIEIDRTFYLFVKDATTLARQTHTRDRLVRTAGELFWRQGYAQTGVSEIMKQARATSGSFYHFFPTKGDLLLAVLDAVESRVETEVVDRAEAFSSDPRARISALAEAYQMYTVPDSLDYGLPVGALVNELGPELAGARRRVGEIYEGVIQRVASWLPDSDRSTAGLVVAALEGAALVALASQNAEAVDVCASQLVAHIEGRGETGDGADEMPPLAETGGEVGDWKAW